MKHPSLTLVPKSGFSLVVTVAMLVVLTVIAVGLLSLSTISIKSTSITTAEQRARSNARMALQMAMDRLQMEMGPDQRVSANSAILENENSGTLPNPNLLGVWDSWRAGRGYYDRAPNYPDPFSSHTTIIRGRRGDPTPASMHPTYADKREAHFRSWLISMENNDIYDINTPGRAFIDGDSLPIAESDAVTLVGLGSLGEDAAAGEYVNAPLVDVSSATDSEDIDGRYGWWIGDESQKAAIMDDSHNAVLNPSIAKRIFRAQAPGSTGTSRVVGLNDLTDEQELGRVISRKSQELLESGDNPARRQQRMNELNRQFHDITYNSFGVFSDVREGGLKRCLNTVLERPIRPTDAYTLAPDGDGYQRATGQTRDGIDFMLYSFDGLVDRRNGNTGMGSVPIQDLAAYYQMYDSERSEWNGTETGTRSGWRDGIIYSSSNAQPSNGILRSGIMVASPDHGISRSDYSNYLRGYTSLYRTPVPIKVEYVLHFVSKPIVPRPPADEDQYELYFGFSPSVTLWNPNNVPLVMNYGSNPEHMTIMMRDYPPKIQLNIVKSPTPNGQVGGPGVESNTAVWTQVTQTRGGELTTVFISGRNQVRFEPGEAKAFSLQASSQSNPNAGRVEIDLAHRYNRALGRYSEPFVPEMEIVEGWNPNRFVIPVATQRAGTGPIMTFNRGEYIRAEIEADHNSASFDTAFSQKSRHGRNLDGVKWFYKSWKMAGRTVEGRGDRTYGRELVYMGFPPQGGQITTKSSRKISILERRTNDLIAAMRNPYDSRDDLPQAIMYYGIKGNVETHESVQGTYATGAGRRYPARPFLHSAPLNPLYMDQTTNNSMYNYGYSWFFMPVNNIQDVPVSITRDNHAYHGGGYTADNGTTHVVQQHLPVTPPISIASLSSARLGGFSMATEAPHWYDFFPPSQHRTEGYTRTTAVGWGGLQPYAIQALGNSYAHPNIPQDRVYTRWNRNLYQVGNTIENYRDPFADHSYLVNKAIWDDYFFSSITPKPSNIPLFYDSGLSAADVARQFFFEETPLPNQRMVPYLAGLDQSRLDAMFTDYDDFRDGFADKIASHMMIRGPFNINSTSVEAWKTVFSSLKGKPVSFMTPEAAFSMGVDLEEQTHDGTPIGGASFANGEPYTGSSSDPSDPRQWFGKRVLTDQEIDELAAAMVKQVKERGPFLSLSEFINRRLDRSSDEFSLKGALQAAIDDPSVSINSGFRGGIREFSSREKSFHGGVFPEAMNGAVAYGSSAYVDQADILQNFAAQLTPRGDTFVIRAYGDALDNNGNVEARAWCEAVVQRTPEYLDSADEDHVKQEDLTSDSNAKFGRKFNVMQFRWLNASEV